MLYSPSQTTGVVIEGAGVRPVRTAAEPFPEDRFAGLVGDDLAQILAAPLLQPKAAAGRPDNAVRKDALPPTAEALDDGSEKGPPVDDLPLGEPEGDDRERDDQRLADRPVVDEDAPSDNSIPILANRERRGPTAASGFGLDVSGWRAAGPHALGPAVLQTAALDADADTVADIWPESKSAAVPPVAGGRETVPGNRLPARTVSPNVGMQGQQHPAPHAFAVRAGSQSFASAETEALESAVSGAGQPAPVSSVHDHADAIDADLADPAAFRGRRARGNAPVDDGRPFTAERTAPHRAPIAGNPHGPVNQLPTRQPDVPARTDAPGRTDAPAVATEPAIGAFPGGTPIAARNAGTVEPALPAPLPATKPRFAEPMARVGRGTLSVTALPPAPGATDATPAPRLVDPLSLSVVQPLPADRSVVPSTATFSTHFAGVGPSPASTSVRELPASLSKAVADGKTDLTLALRPAELGQLTIRLQFVDGQLQVDVRADRPETLQLLQREAEGFERSLRQAGLDLRDGGLQFSAHGDGGRQRPSAGGQIWHGLAREGHEQSHAGGPVRRGDDDGAPPARTIGLARVDRLDLRI